MRILSSFKRFAYKVNGDAAKPVFAPRRYALLRSGLSLSNRVAPNGEDSGRTFLECAA